MPFVAKRVFGHEPLEIKADWGLRDLRPGMAYTLCNSLQCQECAALFLDYRFTDAQMSALYAGYRDEYYTQQRNRYEPGYATTAARYYENRAPYITEVERWLAQYLPESPSVLDWGGGSGINTPFLNQSDLIHIHDISGVPVVPGVTPADPSQFGKQHYDLVVCCQVLEHVPFPLDLLSSLLPTLGAGTLLYLEVPHEFLMRAHPGSLELASLKHHWHEHVNFFSPSSLVRLVECAGLKHVSSHFLPEDIGEHKKEIMGILAKRI